MWEKVRGSKKFWIKIPILLPPDRFCRMMLMMRRQERCDIAEWQSSAVHRDIFSDREFVFLYRPQCWMWCTLHYIYLYLISLAMSRTLLNPTHFVDHWTKITHPDFCCRNIENKIFNCYIFSQLVGDDWYFLWDVDVETEGGSSK